MVTAQQDLFGVADDRFPEGFRYSPDIVLPDLQRVVLEAIPALPFKAFDFHGFEGKRRTVSFGWKYDFDSQSIRKTEPIPSLLLPIREVAAGFAGIAAEALEQALVTEYTPGAPIGWHRDKSV
ncbi:alpha-ketoglutarate-dependent dioxygenase AlkB, partial [Rhizobium phaseoli]